MQTITTIGLDIAKSVFQVHGIDAQGKVIVRRQLKRRFVLAFFQNCRPVSLASKPAPPRIIGRASCRRLGIRHALCRRLT
jgi:transposase